MKTTKVKEKWYAKVTFFTEVMEVKDASEAHSKVDDLVDRLALMKTRLNWDDVDWTLERVVEEDE